MKEILSVPTIHNLPSTNEHEIVQHIYAGMNMASGGPLEGRTGIIEVPDIFREPVKVSMVYPLYYLDLFQAINYNTEIFRTEGFSEIVIVTFVAQLLEALLLLKKRRVVHRDIKPENICLDEDGNLVLLDFELAVKLPEGAAFHIQTDFMAGTSLFVAPETYRRLEYSHSTDLWSVGMIACELWSSQLPWDISPKASLEEVGQTFVEEAIADPIFENFTFTRFEEEEGKVLLTPGNVFDRHDHMENIRELCRHGFGSSYDRTRARARFLEGQEVNTSSMIRQDRSDWVDSFSTALNHAFE
ncbi:hypothetical protein TrVE_jg181 [Triparma verrucosa]|uniref:Protein kinase domain-containing protein n=1 Tax=Triparma verrucosa TaxID=1606542 RepID=A0A9W7B5R8_9STRA|nr:hypothetical protein TrVE_jg181 [Triparma verrucosa]